MDVVKGQGHTIGPVSYQLTSFSFHNNETNNSGDRAILKFDLETSKVKIMSGVKGLGHKFYAVNQCVSLWNGRDTMDVINFSYHVRAD